jgi:hypothetical protein
MTQKELKQKILKGYLEINMRMWDDNIKMVIKDITFVFRVNFFTTVPAKRDFWKRY